MSCFPHRCYSSCFALSNFEGFQIDPGIISARVWFLFRFVKHGTSPWVWTPRKHGGVFSQVGDFSVRIPHGYYSQRTQTCVLIWKYMGIFHGIHAVGPVFHRHPTSQLLVTHVDSIEWTVIIYTYYIDKTLQTHFKHIFFWKWIPFEQKEMFFIPLPWCFFLSGVGRAPHPPPLPKPHPPPSMPAPEAQNDATEAKTHPPKRESETTRSRFFGGNFGGVQWSWKKKVSHPPKVQPIVPKFLFDFVELKLHWLVEEKRQYILSKTVCFLSKEIVLILFYRFNWAMNKSVVVWCI